MQKNWLVAGLAVLGLALGWQLGVRDKAPAAMVATDSKSLPETYWENLDGGQNQLTEWKGETLIINHWATWCEPCRKEIPMFMAVRAQHQSKGLELIGIAHDDEESVRRYVDSMGMDYPQLIADPIEGKKWLAALDSNGSLPLTLVYDKSGQLRAKKLGLMSETELEQALADLL